MNKELYKKKGVREGVREGAKEGVKEGRENAQRIHVERLYFEIQL